jgi:hypothetical protein
MAIYTITTTPDQEAVLAFVVAKANAERDTALTTADYVALRFQELITPYAAQYRKSVGDKVLANFAAADAATRQQVLTLLNVNG